MKLAKRLSAIVGAVALAGALAALLAPKAVRAVTATLVQVVNTPSAPAVTLDVSKAASQILELSCAVAGPGQTSAPCARNRDNGFINVPFVVPAGQHLIITSMDILPDSPGRGFLVLSLAENFGGHEVGLRDAWIVTNSNSTQLQWPTTGIPIGPGYSLSIFDDLQRGGLLSAGGAVVTIHGYLTLN